jgi:peptidoglycan hydrolase-like protein with peptidoglycan-binding domain
MPDEFIGDPTPLRDADYEKAAKNLHCTVAAVRAVAQVESAGSGFLADRRPKVLFERHIFHARTGGKYSAAHSNVSWPQRGGYLGGAREYDRLHEAIALDRKAALESASWGKFQVMAFNCTSCGHPDAESFVRAMVSGEPAQLAAFVAYIKKNKLDDELIRRDWAGFARGYNGSAYAENAYDRKMADAYALFAGGGARTDNPMPLLKLGDTGRDVMHLQELLGQEPDGDFGPATKARVLAFQKKAGLYADGIVGRQSWELLLSGAAAKPASSTKAAPAAAPADRSRPPLRLGDTGEDVKLLQKLLKLAPDGAFGLGTKAAVVAFQKATKLAADGVVGAGTWKALLH